ncbi:MAG TPA: hypothetical protein VNV15_05840 [Opitutaceae bacterium]|jgi:hypothetical protein|nr:hypothetical protein [Opitutaceae bacterium]
MKKTKYSRGESFTEVVRCDARSKPAKTMGEALDQLEAEFGGGKTTVTAKELETSRKLHTDSSFVLSFRDP